MKCVEFNFNAFLKKFIDIFNNLEITSDISNDYKMVNDQKRIKQIFIQLIMNCSKISVSTIKVRIYEDGNSDILNIIFVTIEFYKDVGKEN